MAGAGRDPEFQSRLRVMDIDQAGHFLGSSLQISHNLHGHGAAAKLGKCAQTVAAVAVVTGSMLPSVLLPCTMQAAGASIALLRGEGAFGDRCFTSLLRRAPPC